MTTTIRLWILAVFTPLYAFLMANWSYGWLRFMSPRLNYLFMSLVFLSPLLPLWVTWTAKNRMLKVAGSALFIPVGLVSGCLFLGIVLVLSLWVPKVIVSDVDYSFERLRQERVDDERFGVFRTNGGATTGFGIVVRKERVVFPGLLWTSEVCSSNEADDVRLTRIAPRTIHCEYLP